MGFPPVPLLLNDHTSGIHFIKQVHKANPLFCPQCGGAMRVIALVEQSEVIEKLLTPLALRLSCAHSPPKSMAA
jgi:hypothetical protein